MAKQKRRKRYRWNRKKFITNLKSLLELLTEISCILAFFIMFYLMHLILYAYQ